MKKKVIVNVLLSAAVVLISACGNNNGQQKESNAESVIIESNEIDENIVSVGKWTTKEGQIESIVTLTFNKLEKCFYIHDEMKNPSMTLFDQNRPVVLTDIGHGQYSIKYVQKWDDYYVLNTQSSSLIWYSKDYNDAKMTTREYSLDKLTKSLEVVE